MLTYTDWTGPEPIVRSWDPAREFRRALLETVTETVGAELARREHTPAEIAYLLGLAERIGLELLEA